VWVRAAVDIPHRVHKLLSSLGPKLYCLRLPYVEPSDAEVEDGINEKFEAKRREVQEAVIEESLSIYADLAIVASRVLKNGGSLRPKPICVA
jgi:hypothetical protein